MERQRFTGLMDMIDGGGMGAKGDEFKGGGLLSDIANALFQPAGYRDRMRGRQEARPMARPAGMMPPAPMASPASQPMGSGMTPANNYVGPPQMPMGSGMTPANAYVPTTPPQQYASSGMTPANVYEPMSWADMLQIMAEQQRMQQFGRGGPRY